MEINKAHIEEIKATLNTKGWQIIEMMLNEKFVDNRRPKCFDSLKNKSNEQIATEVKAAEISCRSIKGFITRLKTLQQAKIKTKEGYK